MFTIQQFKNRLESKLHGASLNHVNDPNGSIEEGIRNVVMNTDFYETKRYTRLYVHSIGHENAVVLPDDLKTNSIISQNNLRQNYEYPNRLVTVNDIMRNGFNYEQAVDLSHDMKLLRVRSGHGDMSGVVNNFSILDNWVAAGNVSLITVSANDRITDSSALSLQTSASGLTGSISNLLHADFDYENYVNPIFFLWLGLPDKDLVSVELTVGQDALNYYTVTANTQYTGDSFKVGPNVLSFDFRNITTVGTPTKGTGYVKVSFTHANSKARKIIVDSLQVGEQTENDLPYYSKYLIKDKDTGEWKGRIDDDEDVLVLSDDSINILIYEVASLLAPEVYSSDSPYDEAYYSKKRDDSLRSYVKDYASEKQHKTEFYYRPNHNLRRSGHRGYYR